ncbi:hypothetical protein PPTG_07208 [Phytophthora nicotianae INRA-310]|uniref:Uncharacterized protein n=1 Tax=Phytophthora nicotianae (strain INRA-310) TaxID=761204 RepID=W2QPV5_PHYN3|nr:hypothetical protein PPTG_07208 [Phytophthora nicotianae INRA-310]ETN14981.1 hypothetical protein PPTG_07208 [Phytophthora nicotianae INRA-310]
MAASFFGSALRQGSHQGQEGQISSPDGWTERSGRPSPEHVPAAVLEMEFGVRIDLSTLAHLCRDGHRAFRSLVSGGELAVRSQDKRLARGSSCADGLTAVACKQASSTGSGDDDSSAPAPSPAARSSPPDKEVKESSGDTSLGVLAEAARRLSSD